MELKALIISHQERPPDNMLADPSLQNASETTKPPRNKFNIDWPQDFVPSIQDEYDKIELSEFVSGFLIMIKSYDTASKDAMLAHLELLTIKAISYSWVSVRAFHKFIVKQVEQRRLDWKDFKSIQEQATTFFRHSDLRTSRQRTAEGARLSSTTASTGNHSQAFTPSVPKACRLLISSLMVGLSITPHLHFLLHQYVIIHLVRTQAIGNPRSHLQTANGNFKKYERKSYLFCSILESAVVRSEMEVVLRCENYVQVDALTVVDRLSKKCLVGFRIARD